MDPREAIDGALQCERRRIGMSSSVSKKEDGKGRSRKKDRRREASFLPVSVSAKLARQHVSAA